MSVAGLFPEGGGVELTHVSPTSDNNPAVLGVAQEDEFSKEPSRHLRFQIEDVEEHNLTHTSATLADPNVTISSLGYNTAEAVPMTVYYRKSGEGSSRPTLDDLRQGRIDKPPLAPETTEVDGEAEEAPSLPPPKKWQFWKRNKNQKPKPPAKFGWIVGVLIRCLLNIWGVMLFIRLSWVVGQAGIGLAAVIILLSGLVTVITTLSMSAICTNGEVKGGGAYYLISRSLGPEFGGAIGIIFSLANAVAVALYVVGFAETVSALIEENDGTFTGNPMNDIRVVGFILVTLLLVVALVGLNFEAKIQVILLIILLVAIADFLIGTFIPRGTGTEEKDRGFTGYNLRTIADNFPYDFRPSIGSSSNENFFTVFAVFFPAATGILAGANISGDLKDPQKAIPRGTLLAIIITNLTYLGMAFLAGTVVIRDAPGRSADFFRSLSNCTSMEASLTPFENDTFYRIVSPEAMACDTPPFNISSSFPECAMFAEDSCYPQGCFYGNSSRENLETLCSSSFLSLIPRYNETLRCPFGILNNFQVMEMVSWFGPIVTAGIFAATVSSALTSLISAPKVFQTVCNDKIFPFITFFGKGGWKGTGTEPIRGYLLTYIIAVACIAIGDLNQIAKIISNFFLMAYALINYSCFVATFVKSPGWRPAFKLYNAWVALLGSGICVVIMFIINWYFALVTLFLVALLYKVVDFLKPDINWGSSTQAFLYSYSMRNLLKLEKLEDHVKNFRPQFLVLTGPPSSRPDMVQFVSHLSKEVGVMVCGQVLLGDFTMNRHKMLALSRQQKQWLRKERVKAFHNIVAAKTLREGCQNLLQLSGLGKIRPNTLVVGYKNNWKTCTDEELTEYVSLLHDAFDVQFGVVIFRLRAGFDATEQIEEPRDSIAVALNISGAEGSSRQELGLRQRPSAASMGGSTNGQNQNQPLLKQKQADKFLDVPLSSSNPIAGLAIPSPLKNTSSLGSYQPIVESADNSSVDSYSMALEGTGRLELEDVGITTEGQESETTETEAADTTPDIITMPSRFEKAQEKGFIDVWWLYDDGGLAILLPFLLSRRKRWKNCKLRIFTGSSSRNINQAKLTMTTLLRKFRIEFSSVVEVEDMWKRPSPESIDKYRQLPLDLAQMDTKELDKATLRQIRLGELLHQHSSDAKLIAVTIPVPLRSVSARQYMSQLEAMSWDLPPMLLLRGNQNSVLTFYC